MSSTSKPNSENASRGCVIRAGSLQGYTPANHHGTVNTRLVGPQNGAKYMEIALGELVFNGNAQAHAHPALEQAAYILEGTAVAGIDGVDHEVGAGDMLFFPEGVFHSIRVTSDRLKILVIYAPPYGEDPAKVIR